MKRIGILGDIGSGKSYVAKSFGYPVFNADKEVYKLYKRDKNTFFKLRKILPKYFSKFPIDKNNIIKAILDKKSNLKKITRIVHLEIKKSMNSFLKKNRNKKIIVLDIPLLLENKINKKNDILIFIQANKSDILKNLRKRKNFNKKIFIKFKKIQLSLDYKKKRSQFIIKNDFTKRTIVKNVKNILKQI